MVHIRAHDDNFKTAQETGDGKLYSGVLVVRETDSDVVLRRIVAAVLLPDDGTPSLTLAFGGDASGMTEERTFHGPLARAFLELLAGARRALAEHGGDAAGSVGSGDRQLTIQFE